MLLGFGGAHGRSRTSISFLPRRNNNPYTTKAGFCVSYLAPMHELCFVVRQVYG